MFALVAARWPSLSRRLVVLGIVLSASSLSYWCRWPIDFAQISLMLGAPLPPRPPTSTLQRARPHRTKHAAGEQLLTETAETTMDPQSSPHARATRHRSHASVPLFDREITASGGSRANSSSSMPPPPLPLPRGHHHSHSSASDSDDTTLSHASPMPTHARSMSHADATSRQNKRLSLNFPVQPAANGAIPAPRSARPASWIGASPVRSETFHPNLSSPPPDGNFFTALAAQERRVLELKEELSKAEEQLKELKKQWANQEAARKGQKEGYGFHPLPLNTSVAPVGLVDDDADGPNWMQKEMERRRAILHGQRQSKRKVFSGSRHTRTLSLLSPTKTSSDESLPQPLERRSDDIPSSAHIRERSSTTPDITSEPAGQDDNREALLRTGRQMASDFKDGLWTFIEDLRQATVGDEAINGTPSRSGSGQQIRRQPSGANIATTSSTSLGRSKSMGHARKPRTLQPSGDGSALIDIETNFWKENGLDAPTPPKPAVVKPARTSKTPEKQLTQASSSFDESWDDWDTPNENKFVPGHSSTNSSISEGRTSQCSDHSSPRTSTSSVPGLAPLDIGKVREQQQENAAKRMSSGPTSPWHALSKLSPSNVKRAASNFMDEWEKSITSPTEATKAEVEALEEYLSSMTPTKTGKAQ